MHLAPPADLQVDPKGTVVIPPPGRLLGIEIARDDTAGHPTFPQVTGIFRGSPAEDTGIRIGDRIEATDGIPATGTMSEIIRRLWVPEGSYVTRDLRHADGEPFTVTLP